MTSCTRVTLPVVHPIEQGNLAPLYPLDHASWLWHPECAMGVPAVVRFHLAFSLAEPVVCRLHVSGDQRYVLWLDGRLISRGPDRGDLQHWAFASYEVALAAGAHRLTALVSWVGDWAPVAQISWRGGFALAAEGPLAPVLTTGQGAWQVERLAGWRFSPASDPAFTGARQELDGEWFTPGPAVAPEVVRKPITPAHFGAGPAGWRLYPSELPDQLDLPRTGGRIRALLPGGFDPRQAMPAEGSDPAWQALVEARGSVTIPPRTRLAVLWDLGDYVCAYPTVHTSGGADSTVRLEWAEGLYATDPQGNAMVSKGHRDEIAGKYFLAAIGDRCRPDGGAGRAFPNLWWRAGRYVLIEVTTAAAPLTLDRLELRETRYPLAMAGSFRASDERLAGVIPLMLRGMQMCSHETFVDCPYYEQLHYVGDTRLEMLTTHVLTADDRLVRRCLQLFNWSRCHWGMVAEHYPSRLPQQSCTYALLWAPMLHDYALWRDDAAFVRAQLPGLRANLEQLLTYLREDDLPGPLPGWSFVDWVPTWHIGNAPAGADGLSAPVALHYVLALEAAAALERELGDRYLAERYGELARRIARRVFHRFWRPERNLLADDTAGQHFSEHAQCLALLTETLPTTLREACCAALFSAPDLARTTIYFSWYLFEVCQRCGRTERFRAALGYWFDLREKGLRTPQESPEPVRSDCHAWGSHPLFHYYATLAGIRPASLGFRTVLIRPALAGLTELVATMPHPRGPLTVELRAPPGGPATARIVLPPGVTGQFEWLGRTLALAAGENRLG
jgi:hypothetical protein